MVESSKNIGLQIKNPYTDLISDGLLRDRGFGLSYQ
jgi:hypothetical protein